jgi:hypothetical protein
MELPESAAGLESALSWKTYAVSRSEKLQLLEFIIHGLAMRGCVVIFTSEPSQAPLYIVFETPAGERHGVLAYCPRRLVGVGTAAKEATDKDASDRRH